MKAMIRNLMLGCAASFGGIAALGGIEPAHAQVGFSYSNWSNRSAWSIGVGAAPAWGYPVVAPYPIYAPAPVVVAPVYPAWYGPPRWVAPVGPYPRGYVVPSGAGPRHWRGRPW